jgi:hypothetical protein
MISSNTLNTDDIKCNNELLLLSKSSKLKYNINAKNSSKHIKIDNDDKIIAFESISKNEEICISEPLISYYRPNECNSKSLLLSLNLLSTQNLNDILGKIWDFKLYPASIENMELGLKELYKSDKPTDEIINSLFKQAEHIIHVYLRYNHFNIDNNRYLYLLASKFNHSCDPNCDWKIKDGIIKITSLREILPYEECTISYIGLNSLYSIKSTIERQNIILKNCCFICQCKQCIKIPTDKCFVCKNKTNLSSCAKCKNIFYCGKECQLLHWSLHKYSCNK